MASSSDVTWYVVSDGHVDFKSEDITDCMNYKHDYGGRITDQHPNS